MSNISTAIGEPDEDPTGASARSWSDGTPPIAFKPDSLSGEPDLSLTTTSAGTPHTDGESATQIGPYHILGRIGAGGMGEVFKAERRGALRQVVAIKIIKLGYDSREVIARFESEREALSRMNHPNVARVLDAGTDERGRPYFVMEYVPGTPVTEFADTHRLTTEDRLKLFMQACDAIAHAHTKALIHRDIKDANVLAYMQDGVPTIKVIDFGIAKALTAQRLTDATFNTGMGQIIGTFDSMSPEQADSSPDIDTRTDVYSLGVLLYELLTGFPPFDRNTLARAGEQEIRRMIREVDPKRPSMRLRDEGNFSIEQAEFRQTQVQSLASQLRRELEWIPLMAMRKQRSRRYASPLQLSEDIQNYLNGKPLIAGPETAAYRTRKLLSRNPLAFAISAASVLMIAVSTAWYVRDIRQEQRRTQAALTEAQEEKAEADRQRDNATLQATIAESMRQRQNQLLSTADPSAIDVEIEELDSGSLKDRPIQEAAERNAIGVTLTSRHEFDKALPMLRRALEIRRSALPAGHPDIAESMASLATLLQQEGKFQEADKLFHGALESYENASPPRPTDVAATLNSLALLEQFQNRPDAAEKLYRQSLEIYQRLYEATPDHPDIARALNNLASLAMSRNDQPQAEKLFREALQMNRALLPAGNTGIGESENNLAFVLLKESKYAEAEKLSRDSLDIFRAVFPEVNPNVMNSVSALGRSLVGENKLAEAEPLLREVVETRIKTLGATAGLTQKSATALAELLDKTNRTAEASALRTQCGIGEPQ